MFKTFFQGGEKISAAFTLVTGLDIMQGDSGSR